MDKKELVTLLNETFIPLGFNKKGNSWVSNGDVLCKMVTLQKSNFSNSFYLNYGYILPKLQLTTSMHVFKRLGSFDPAESKQIAELLALDNGIQVDKRLQDLKKFITDQIVAEFLAVKTEGDLLSQLKKWPTLSSIPLVVKKHFGLN